MGKTIELEGTRLKTARRRRGLSLQELSALVDVRAAVLEDWEECRAWCNSEEVIQRLALSLKFPPGFFTGPEIENLQPWQVNMCRIDYDAVIICAACGEPITGDDLYDRHWGHEDGCPNKTEPDSVDCNCDLEYHEGCCPDCKSETE